MAEAFGILLGPIPNVCVDSNMCNRRVVLSLPSADEPIMVTAHRLADG